MAAYSTMLALLFLVCNLAPLNSLSSGIIQMELTHVDAGADLATHELIRRAVHRGRRRISRLKSMQSPASAAALDPPLFASESEFFTNLSIGTPQPVQFSAVVDTGSDLIWTQCEPCTLCFEQPTPIFDPSKSSTFREVSCSSNLCQELEDHSCNQSSCQYTYAYAGNFHTRGVLATESFLLDGTTVPSVAFGCGHENGVSFPEGAAGIVGLGRGPLSLISQIDSQKFSYCLTSYGSSKSSRMLIGSLPDLNSSKLVVSTPIIMNPSISTFYYLNLTGITVGEALLDIPNSTFSINPDDGSGGFIIDSGTSITFLAEAAYEVVADAFLNQTKLKRSSAVSDVDLCFDVPENATLEGLELPGLIFHFEGADLDLPKENYFVLDSSILCLVIYGTNDMSVFGNYQQQNMQVLYNLEDNILTFSPSQCG